MNIDVVGIGSCAVDYFAIVPRLLGPEEKINATPAASPPTTLRRSRASAPAPAGSA